LALGGRLVVPVGPDGQQQLLRITRRDNGVKQEVLEKVAFVPLLSGVTGG
jgi:protein-L-isoaspartate(D-aspartate) O-methyltransferase